MNAKAVASCLTSGAESAASIQTKTPAPAVRMTVSTSIAVSATVMTRSVNS